jgi:hypothetical protein
MPRLHHYFSSNLSARGIWHDVLLWHGAELVPPWPAFDPAQAARLGRRQHNLQRRRRSGTRLGHHIRSRLQSHLGDDLDGVRILLVDLGVDRPLLLHLVILAVLHRPQTVPGHGEGLRIRDCSCTKIGRVVRICLIKIVMTVKLGRPGS